MVILAGLPSVVLFGQYRQVRIGFQSSPALSWIRNNDELILSNGSSLGMKLGVMGEIAFRDPLVFTVGFNFAFHHGGQFLYEIGGNYLPNSALSDEMLQTGKKPLPDGTMIRYSMQYLEFPVGLKYRSPERGNLRYTVEAPMLTFSLLTRARGQIETWDGVYEGENIYEDLGLVNIFVGLGAGIEYALSRTNSIILGLCYQQGLLDFTKDDGHRAIMSPDPVEMYLIQTDASRATVGTLTLRTGLLF